MIETVRVARTTNVVRIVRVDGGAQTLSRDETTVRLVAAGTGVPGPQGAQGPQGDSVSVSWGPDAPLNPQEGDLWLQTT